MNTQLNELPVKKTMLDRVCQLCSVGLTGYGLFLVISFLIPLLWPVLIVAVITGALTHDIKNTRARG